MCGSHLTVKKCRAIAVEKLKSMQKQMVVAEPRMKQDVTTRWNSDLLIMERTYMLDIRRALCYKNFLTKCVLKPIKHMTIEVSAQNYPSMSLVVSIVRGLQYAIRTKQIKTTKGECLKSSLLEVISRLTRCVPNQLS